MERHPREGGVEHHPFYNSKYLLEALGALLYISEDRIEGLSCIAEFCVYPGTVG